MAKESFNNSTKTRILSFVLDAECYGIEITEIKEIIAYAKPTKIPKTPDFLVGVINLRGNIIPVVDLRTKFKMEKNELLSSAIVIAFFNGINLGFLVDSVEEVVPTDNAMYSEPPKFGEKSNANYIKSMIRTEEGVIMLLNLEALFSYQELAQFEGL